MSIRRKIQLILDKAAAKKAERDAKKSLDKGTDPKKPKKNIGRIKKSLNGLVSVAKKAAVALAGIWVVKKVFEYGKAVFKLGADVRAVQSQFNTVFGASAGVLSSFLEEFRRVAGLTRREAQRLAASAGSMVQGMGASAEASADFSKEVLKLSADLASFNNIPTAQAAQLVQSALIGNTEAARSLGVSFTAADVQARALADTGKSSAAELTQLEKVMAGLSVITERAGPQIGDLVRTQHDADNQAKNLAASFTQLKDSLAAAVVGGTAGSTIFADITAIIEDLTGWVEINSAEIGHWSSVFITALRAVGTTAAGIFNLVRHLFGATAAEMVRLVRQAQLEIALVVDAIATGVNAAIEGLNKLPGVDIDFRMAGQPIEEFEAMRDAAAQDLQEELRGVTDALVQIGQGWLDVAEKARSAERAQRDAAAAGAGSGGSGGGGGGGGDGEGDGLDLDPATGPALAGPGFLRGVEDQLVSQTQSIAENMRSVLQDNNPFEGLTEHAATTAAFMRDGFAGVGHAIVRDLIAGRAEEQFAQGMAKLAEGIWPPNPAALASAGKHFAAAEAFRQVAGSVGGGGGAGGGAVGGAGLARGAIGTSTPGSRQLNQSEVHIYIDPFDPDNALHQRQVGRAAGLARERFGDQVPVKLHHGRRTEQL